MISPATPSKWESSVLGVRVGAVSSDKVPAVDATRAVNRGLFDVVFVTCPKWVECRWGRVAVDYLYDMETVLPEEKRPVPFVSTLVAPGKELVEIARTSPIESRFDRDPILFRKSKDRFVRWLTDNKAYVPAESPDSAFLVPGTDEDGARRITLIMVSVASRGNGIGTRLVLGTFAAEPASRLWRVKVSARNRRALRFYETLGFRVKSISTVFHIWVSK